MMFQQPANEAPSLDDYLRAISSRKWLVILATLAGFVTALLYQGYKTDTYEAEARVVVGPSRLLSLDSNRAVAPNLEREREIILGDDVFQAAAQDLGIEIEELQERVKNVTVRFTPDSQVLTITGTDSDPNEVTLLINAISEAYVSQVETAERAFFSHRIEILEESITSSAATLTNLDAELATLASNRTAASSLPAEDPSKTSLISAIDADRNIRQTNRQQLIVSIRASETTLRDLRVQLNTRPSTASLLSPARLPQGSFGISETVTSAAGLMIGCSLGIAAAFILSRLDRRAREQGDIEVALGRKVLSSIPSFGFGRSDRRGEGALIMTPGSKSPRLQRPIEAFRRLRTGVDFLAQDESLNAFLLSSAFPSEGKSTVSANLAMAFAQSGQRTVLVSADLRRPSLERLFGVEADTGLSEWLGGDDDIDLLIDLSEPNLHFIPAGKPAQNSSELLGSDRFKKLVEELKSNFDKVLIDTPPILATADAGAASKHVDGVIIVVDSRTTETDQLIKVRSDLDRAGSTLLGAVLNRERQKRALPWRKRDRYSYAYV